MEYRSVRYLAVVALVAAFASVGTPARAQTFTGRIDITIEDSTGGRLPGVNVDLSGQMIQSAVSDARGEVHFLNLNVGTYQVKASLAGFNDWKNTNVPVAGNVSVPLAIKMTVAGAKEEVTVTGESPVLDTKKQTTAVNVSLEELQNVPSARDPWVVMQTVPSIVMDRVNVGGSESGQQAGFIGKGAASQQATWSLDGMPITDMGSVGSSAFYYDFDMFSEIGVQTGGADAKAATGGVQMNMILKSGTNVFHGNAKFYFENESMQASNLPSDLSYLGGASGKGDRTDLFRDFGGDVGGPILKDRWWFWGSAGKQDIRIIKLNGATDKTALKNYSFKTQAQITKAMRGSFTYFSAGKYKWGRNAGATFTQPSTVDQAPIGGPNYMAKAEVNYVVGNNLFLVGRYAHVRGGFSLTPEGGSDTPAWTDDASVWHGSYNTYTAKRPQSTLNMDGNYFKGAHEVKFGFSWRKMEVHSTTTWANDYYTMNDSSSVLSGTGVYPYMLVNVQAPHATDVSAKWMHFYIGDTMTMKRLTANFGIRYDKQAASVLPSAMEAPSTGIIPSLTAPGINDATKYGMWQPRAGLTYALNQSRKTQLRATYALFTNQIGAQDASFLSVAQYRGYYLDALDKNGDHIAQSSEIIQNSYPLHVANGDYWGYDPTNPGAIGVSYNKVGNYGNPKTHEFVVGFDHELMPNFGVSASYTYRRMIDFNWSPVMSGTGVMDGTKYTLQGYITGSLPTGIDGSPSGSYNVPYYAPSAGVTWDSAKGTIYDTRPDYHQVYKGLEISATKRMANHWMARFGFSTNSWREYFASPAGQTDPTQTRATPNINGGYVVNKAGASGKSEIYMVQPKYQIMANGAYQLPYDFDLGANFLIRQGYPMPWNWSTSGGFKDPLNGSSKRLLLTPDYGYARLSPTATVDMRVGKRLKFGPTTVSLDLDIFNLFNSATILGRTYSKNSSIYTQVQEIMQPRIMRIGARFTF
jgi:hypothetical protein